MPTDPRTTPIQSIQVLRAVAAFAVMLLHICNDLAGRLGVAGIWSYYYLGNVGVDLFFVISGFVMVCSSGSLFGRSDGPRRFFLRRLSRIVPLYWAIGALYLGVVFLGYFHRSPVSFDWIVASFLFIPLPGPDGAMQPLSAVGWTLNYEMLFYAIFAVALLLPRRKAVVAVVTLLALSVAVGRAYSLPQPLAYWSDPIILEFCLGALIALARAEATTLPLSISLALTLTGALGFAATPLLAGHGLPRVVFWGLPAALVVAGLTLAPVRQGGILSRALAKLGDASYALYLLHPIVLTAGRWVLTPYLDPKTFPLTYASILVSITVVAALLVYRYFEQPMTAVARRWLDWTRSPPIAAGAPAD